MGVTGSSVDVVVTGGGTGGHVYPGLAVAEVLRARGRTIHWIGAEGRMEADAVPRAGLPISLLAGRGAARAGGVKALLANAAGALELVGSVRAARRLLRELAPSVVLGVGGFASGPTVLAAWRLGIPIVLAEQNRTPGRLNRFMAKRAKATAVAFPGTPLDRAEVTGNPVAARFFEAGAERRQPPVVLVFGGSGGSEALNAVAVELEARWRGRDDVVLRHVFGPKQPKQFAGAPPARPGYEPVQYEYDMPTAMAEASLAVTRAGSGTCFELAASGLPAVLVPSPNVTDDHQTGNAWWLMDEGGARLLPDRELTADRLELEIDELLADPSALAEMADAARTLARPDAAERIADLVERHARA